jgi:sugar O-acyltransferase (sialic acid O-acetyltransferase NeuD family)
MKKIIIFGSGDNARMIFSELVKSAKYDILGFIDNFKNKKIIEKYKNKNFYNLGTIKENKNILKKTFGVIGIGDNYKRFKVYSEINVLFKNFEWEKIISNKSNIHDDVPIGNGSVIMPNVTINFGSKIGNHCLINTSSSLDHDNHFEDFSSTGPGIVTGGRVSVGKLTHIGLGAVIQNKCKIGKNTIIGANSLVNKNCEDNLVYYGNPVKKIRKRLKGDKYL